MAGGGVKINNINITGGANGKTPIFKLENGILYNSYDNGDNWYALGRFTSIPAGGNAGQILGKKTNADYDVEWKDGGGLAEGIQYLTSAPTQANADGLKFVVLTEEPQTRYSGYIYIITEV